MGVVKLSTAGILDYLKTSNFLSGNAPVSFGAFDLLETTTLTSSASSVTFSGLDAYSGYKHLQIRMVVQSNNGATMWMRINADSGTNYSTHYLSGQGSSVSSSSFTGSDLIYITPGGAVSAAVNANAFTANVMDILDFSSANKNTTIRSLFGNDINPRITFLSGLWNSTSAVTSLELSSYATGFSIGSRFSLYGVK
jgi:hypothetical protein